MAWRKKLHEIIFGVDTPAGKAFDLILLWAIILSVGAVIIESVKEFEELFGTQLRILEWTFTILFSIEYILRLISAKNAFQYARSFFGIIDLLSIIPTYLSLYIAGSQSLLVIRGFRLLRIFRILKLGRFTNEGQMLLSAIKSAREKVTVFIGSVMAVVLFMGALMYLIEGGDNGFDNIPHCMYWAIVTMTTVGYGNVVPHTEIGKVLASIIMVMGYGLIAVPTGIVTVELSQQAKLSVGNKNCKKCKMVSNNIEASYCWNCGGLLS